MSAELVVGKAVSHAPGLRTYIAQLNGDPNFQRPSLMPRGVDRKQAVAQELTRVNNQALAQAAPGLEALKQQGLVTDYSVNPFSNTLVIDVPDARAAEAWRALNAVPATGQIVRNREVRLAPIETAEQGAQMVQGEQKIEWNVAKVGAPELWKQGVTGKDVTVGIVDTGVDLKHPALQAKYRGTKADGTFDHSYNFFDAFGKNKEPYDDNKHGTHVAGTAVGGTPEHAIGVAPEAKWIASKILSGQGSGTLETVTKGLEWMLAPTDADGKNPDPKKAPDIVSNSWGTNNGRLTAFQNIWKAFLAAGIEPVAAAGNSGPRTGSVGAPGSYPESISVGATDKDDKLASFSSKGPSPIKDKNGNDLKPDVTAPGAAVTSSVPGGGYGTFSGTSMATPAVSGVVALLLSKHKDLSHDEVVKALHQGVVDLGAKGPDNEFGHGRVDAVAALKAADEIVKGRKPTQPPAQPPAQG